MPPDPRLVADTKAWLDKAILDLRAAENERTANNWWKRPLRPF
jgi:hypothetical protein